ncbi:MAG: HEAT repeat domain-containing protein [Planctomycetota bacterium]
MNTKRLWVPLLLTGLAFAQELPNNDALRAAIAVEELEHDDATAQKRYDAIAKDAEVPDPIRRHAMLRLGLLCKRRGDDAAARIALESAGKGDDEVARRAQQTLGAAPQDVERAKHLEAAATEAVDKLFGGRGGSEADILWFGDAAVAPLLRFAEMQLERNDTLGAQQTASLLWRIRGKVATVALTRALQGGSEERVLGQDSIARAVDDKRDLLRQMLQDKRPAVVIAALAARAQSDDALLGFLPDGRLAVRRRALIAVLQRLAEIPRPRTNAETTRLSERVAAVLPAALDATSPEDARNAAAILCRTALYSPAGRKLLAARIARDELTGTGHLVAPDGTVDFDGDAECADLLADAAESLATRPDAPQRPSLLTFIDFMMRQKAWKRAALDPVLRLAKHRCLDTWIAQWLFDNAQPDDVGAVIAMLGGTPSLCATSSWLSRAPLRSSDYEPLLSAFEAIRGSEESRIWKYDELLVPIGRTGRPEALALLRELRTGAPRVDDTTLARAAIQLAHRARTEDSRVFLRELLDSPSVEPRWRVAAFGELVRLGDTAIWGKLDALSANDRTTQIPIAEYLPDAASFEASQICRIDDWLTLAYHEGEALKWWHGYSEEQLDMVWRFLLARRHERYSDVAWNRSGALAYQGKSGELPVPDRVYISICAAYRERCTQDDAFNPSGTGLNAFLWAAAYEETPPSRKDALAALRGAAFAAVSTLVRREVVQGVQIPMNEATLRRVRAMVGDRDDLVAAHAWEKLAQQKVAIDHALVALAVASKGPGTRELALTHASESTEAVTDLVTPLLHDDSPDVRVQACKFLAARVDYESVPALLETLKDGEDNVRRAAAEALQAIRLYHDEKARWARVLGGKPEIGTAAAAEALVDRAQPKNDKATRLLAIRGLGDLGAPEPLALLIDWTKDQDADIAQAAREAIQAIHLKAK